jgi:ubiquinone/menaquinone biosynthesis C-methylase UbiE
MNDVASAYDVWSTAYDTDENRTRDLDAVTMSAWLDARGRRFAQVVEAGCGTGKNTVVLAAVAEAVHAVDFSPGMLARARAKVGVPHVRFSEADLCARWPVADASADLVTFNLVLEHVERLEPVFAEAARVLQRGGVLRVSELHPFRQYRGTQARFAAPDGGVSRIPAFVHHVSDYVRAAERAGNTLVRLDEWWHETDAGEPPRLLTLEFSRR